MLLDWKGQYYQDGNSPQIDGQTKYNPYQNPS